MIRETNEDMFSCGSTVLVNTVNCVGVMGKGLALKFKQLYPEMFLDYKKACILGEVVPGTMHVWSGEMMDGIREGETVRAEVTVINFPTKRHWRDQSRMEDIEAGLDHLVLVLRNLGKSRVSVPALGCRNGGLDWPPVRDMIFKKLSGLDVEILVHPPRSDL